MARIVLVCTIALIWIAVGRPTRKPVFFTTVVPIMLLSVAARRQAKRRRFDERLEDWCAEGIEEELRHA